MGCGHFLSYRHSTSLSPSDAYYLSICLIRTTCRNPLRQPASNDTLLMVWKGLKCLTFNSVCHLLTCEGRCVYAFTVSPRPNHAYRKKIPYMNHIHKSTVELYHIGITYINLLLSYTIYESHT